MSDNCINEYLLSAELENVLYETYASFCEQFSFCEECTKAVINLKLDKSPGLDSLTYEFFNAFGRIHNNLFENDQLSYSQRMSVFSHFLKERESH